MHTINESGMITYAIKEVDINTRQEQHIPRIMKIEHLPTQTQIKRSLEGKIRS